MVIILPPHHISMRALEWLSKATTIYGNQSYIAPVGEAACNELHAEMTVDPAFLKRRMGTLVGLAEEYINRTKLIKEWSCNTEDMRAIWLSSILGEPLDYTVQYQRPGPNWVKGPAPVIPTCQECKVLMDKASQNAPMKYGQYLKWWKRGQYTPTGFHVPNDGLRWYFSPLLVEQCPWCEGAKVQRVLKTDSAGVVVEGVAECSECKGRGYTTKGFPDYKSDDHQVDATKYVIETLGQWDANGE